MKQEAWNRRHGLHRATAQSCSPPIKSPWAVPWSHHNDFTDLYYEDHTRHFLVRARVTPDNIQRLRKLIDCMEGIFALSQPGSPFTWPVLDNTWGGP